jgi:hypothetical protein
MEKGREASINTKLAKTSLRKQRVVELQKPAIKKVRAVLDKEPKALIQTNVRVMGIMGKLHSLGP